MLQQGARLEGIPGMQEKIRLWTMSGMCTKTQGDTVYLINASGGEPDKPSRTAARSSRCRRSSATPARLQ